MPPVLTERFQDEPLAVDSVDELITGKLIFRRLPVTDVPLKLLITTITVHTLYTVNKTISF